jgi:hypothetical protein
VVLVLESELVETFCDPRCLLLRGIFGLLIGLGALLFFTVFSKPLTPKSHLVVGHDLFIVLER